MDVRDRRQAAMRQLEGAASLPAAPVRARGVADRAGSRRSASPPAAAAPPRSPRRAPRAAAGPRAAWRAV